MNASTTGRCAVTRARVRTPATAGSDTRTQRLIVPWQSVVVMAEVPPVAFSGRLAAIGSYSGNSLVGIAYDAIPIVSADLVPPRESSGFVRYLTAVKFARRMAGISNAATAEIQGFVQMLPTQGLPGPLVTEVSLPSPVGVAQQPDPGRPTSVLVVGSHEPRKNHLAILHAAEILWREGLAFRLRFIGGSGWGTEFPRRVADLKAAGRSVEVLRAVDDATLDRAFDEAAFTLFPSLHEGYGLPVAESLAHGTPVITSNFGSTPEIAVGGGVLTVDPRDDGALTDAMRKLLADKAALPELREQIGDVSARTWHDYATQLWEALVAPELARRAQPAEAPAPLDESSPRCRPLIESWPWRARTASAVRCRQFGRSVRPWPAWPRTSIATGWPGVTRCVNGSSS